MFVALGKKNRIKAFSVALVLFGMLWCFWGTSYAYGDENTNSISYSTYAGSTRVETAVKQSQAAFQSSDYAILVGKEGWPDALAAAGLSGALNCPILFTDTNTLPSATVGELERLGTTKVLIIGSSSAVSGSIEDELGRTREVHRIGGETRYDTQLEIYSYGKQNNLWQSDYVFFTSGNSFPDALSVSPIAFAHKSPIFLIDATGELSASQKTMLLELAQNGLFAGTAVLAGGDTVISQRAEGFISGLNRYGSSADRTIRLSGETRYDTNAAVNVWAVENAGMTWSNVAFASGVTPYDALTGSAFQGKQNSLVALVGNALSPSIASVVGNLKSIGEYRYFGGDSAISPALRAYIQYSLRFGYALPMGRTELSDGSGLWCDSSGVYREDNVYYAWWLERANWYWSATDWMIIVDTNANKVMVFEHPKGKWIVAQEFTCTSGAWSTPTVKGEFTVASRGLSFGSGYTCWYWTQFYGNYLFHSVLYNPGSMTSIQDGRLGINASHGCVRLALQNAKWIYDNIPRGTKVVVW